MKPFRPLDIVFAAIASFFLGASIASGEELAPDALMKRISEDVIAGMRDDRDIRAGDAAKAAALIEAKILPYFDFQRITRLAMGSGWRQATPEQRDELKREFQTLL